MFGCKETLARYNRLMRASEVIYEERFEALMSLAANIQPTLSHSDLRELAFEAAGNQPEAQRGQARTAPAPHPHRTPYAIP